MASRTDYLSLLILTLSPLFSGDLFLQLQWKFAH